MRDLLSRVPRIATRHRNGKLEEVPLDDIVPGDRLLIRQGDVSVISNSSIDGSAPLVRNDSDTCVTNDRSVNWWGDRFTAIEKCGRLAWRHALAWRQACSMTHLPSGMMKLVASATWMKRSGPSTPSVGWCQRISASTPSSLPELNSIFG